jgi:RimJ/RimL family protein N-acetyltransferase
MQNQLPEQLESRRLIIRVARPEDGSALNEAIVQSLQELKPWLPWVSPAPCVAQSELTCRSAYARYLLNEDLMVLLFLRETGELVGGSGLHRVNWPLRQFEIGYWGRTQFSGRGLITEAVKTLTEHALHVLKANRVYLTTDARNAKSCKVAELAGFELEGILRNERFDLDCHLRDTKIYARVPIKSLVLASTS